MLDSTRSDLTSATLLALLLCPLVPLCGLLPGSARAEGDYTVRIQVEQPIAGSVNSQAEKKKRALELIDLITEIVEPDAWTLNGGTWATITYVDGMLVVRAPDFVQREIGGYPRVPRPGH